MTVCGNLIDIACSICSKMCVHTYIHTYIYIYIYIYIRRPRQTQGGARQGIILLTLVSGVFGRNFDACPSFTAMVFSHPGAVF